MSTSRVQSLLVEALPTGDHVSRAFAVEVVVKPASKTVMPRPGLFSLWVRFRHQVLWSGRETLAACERTARRNSRAVVSVVGAGPRSVPMKR